MKTPLIDDLLAHYRARRFTPGELIDDVLARIDAAPERCVWITRLSRAQIMKYVQALDAGAMERLPLYGVPFAIKDNIDLASVATTAGCPGFAYTPRQSATVVRKLVAAGAIPIGKTNLDQFATGLVGVRSPYGACMNSFDSAYIAGGSSSGSAVAVATGLVSFALGTDTAGSGRVPAAFNNIIGLKPSCGLISTSGVVPACRSLDTVSIFALTAGDARRVLDVARGFDAEDPYSIKTPLPPGANSNGATPCIGLPLPEQLKFFGDLQFQRCFSEVRAKAQMLGWTCMEIDIAPLLEAARLLYDGPWVAERYAAIGDFVQANEGALLPVTRDIIAGGRAPQAADLFRAQHRLKALQRASEQIWSAVDALLTPTAGTIYTIEQVLADPVALNSNLGYYTNFVNLLDLAAVATPAGVRSDGFPFGATLIAPSGSDSGLLRLADQLHRACMQSLGATGLAMPDIAEQHIGSIPDGYIGVVVCGAHMTGLSLNHQLQERGGYLVRATTTSAHYRFYALPGGPPQRPGLIRVTQGGSAIAVELWAVPQQHLGSFVAGIPAPLGIGKIELHSGEQHSGFLCEPYALEGARDITSLGSWRRHLAEDGKP